MKFAILVAMFAASITVGCTRVDQGEFGIVKHFGGSVDDAPAGAGYNMTLFSSIETIDATEIRVPMKDLTPKDKDGVLFTLDMTVTYKINPEKAVGFYKQTHEVDKIVENNIANNVLGYRVLEDVVANSSTKAFNDFTVAEIGPRRSDIEQKMKEIIQAKIDARYADAFQIVNVNINRTKLGDSVEQVLQSQAIAKSQRTLLDLQQQLAEKETDLLNKKFEGMKRISNTYGIPVERVMNYKVQEQYNGVLSEIAKNHQGTTLVNVNQKE
jgi:hypothetical protein